VKKITDYKRIAILGNSGSGKSFFAKRLAEITGIPLIHLDVEYWRPDWEETPKSEWIKGQTEIISEKEWIIDGNYISTLDMRFIRADLVVFLDIHPFVCMISAFRRHGKKRSDLPQYLEEKLDMEFLQFCKFIWQFNKAKRGKIIERHNKYPEKPFLIISSRRELNKILKNCERDIQKNFC